MTDLDAAKRRFEVLKIARDLLNEQYLSQRQETHTRWLAESEAKYKATGELLAYPASTPYPSESEIIEKAASLYKYVETGNVQPPPLSSKEAQALARISPSPEQASAPQVTAAQSWNSGPLPVEQHMPSPVPAPVSAAVPGTGAVGMSAPAPIPAATPATAPIAPAAPAPAPSPTPAATLAQANSQVQKIFAQASNNLIPSAYAPSPLPVGLPLSFLPPTTQGSSNV